MNKIWRTIGKVLAFDLTGRTWTRELAHPRLGRIIYFGAKDPTQCYWEAECGVPGQVEIASATMTGTIDGPTADEELFLNRLIAGIDMTFENCRKEFDREYEKLEGCSIPTDWRSVMYFEGASIPARGDIENEWSVSFCARSLGCSLTAYYERGSIGRVSVDS